jgi:peptidoglycan-N-acetylglucosamine deacetylase
MKRNPSAGLIMVFITTIVCNGQTYSTKANHTESDFSWPPGIEMALSLTFDDARLSQMDYGIPLLDKYNVKATFYISHENLVERLEGWEKALINGHDIGNHTLFHPCSGNFLWSRDRALENYTLDDISFELDSANKLINELLGIQPVSFAYPCGQTFIGRGLNTRSYIPVVASLFETGRGWLGEVPNDPAFCDLAQLTGIELDGKSFEQIIDLINDAKKNNQWLILVGHEIGEKGPQTSRLNTIEAICKYANNPENGIWIDNIQKVASYLKAQRRELQIP